MPVNNFPLAINQLDGLRTKNVDMKGRRDINCGDAQDPQDYVTLAQLKALLATFTPTSVQSTFQASNVAVNTIIKTLGVASTTITASFTPAIGALLVVLLTQDATGGRAITWDVMFSGASFQIDGTALTISTFLFTGNGTKWVMTGTPSTGMVP